MDSGSSYWASNLHLRVSSSLARRVAAQEEAGSDGVCNLKGCCCMCHWCCPRRR